MSYAPLGPFSVGPGAVATNFEVDPDAVALSTSFDSHPDQRQEPYEESVAKGQVDVANAYRAQAGLEALSTKSTPFRLIGTATAVVATAALVSFWQQRSDSTRRLGEDDTPDSSTEPRPVGFFGITLMGVILMVFMVGVVTRHNVAPSLVRLVFNIGGEGGDAVDLPRTDGDKPPSLRLYVASNPRNRAAYPDTTDAPNPVLCCATANTTCFKEGLFSGVSDGDPFGIITQMEMIKDTEKHKTGYYKAAFFPFIKDLLENKGR
jgi:hypothetical protein